MKIVLQRVKSASVTVDNKTVSSIDDGFLVLLGVKTDDDYADADCLVKKTAGLRIFEDENQKMNLPLSSVNGSVLVVSNFTLYADCKSGYRPSFSSSAGGDKAKELYDYFCKELSKTGISVQTGIFGADMIVNIVNDGPVTIVIDSNDLISK